MKRLLIIATVTTVACHHQPEVQPLPVYGPARDTLLRLDLSRTDSSRAHGVAGTLLALSDRDAAYQRAGAATVFGRDNIRALLAADTIPADVRFVWQPLGGEISLDHNSGYTFGITVHGDSARRLGIERYVAFWRRPPGGPWRIVAYSEIGGPVSSVKDLPLQSPPLQPDLSRRARRIAGELMSADSAFSDLADRQGIATAFSSNVAPDGFAFAGGQIVIGPRAVRELFATRPTGNTLTWRPIYAVVAGSEDLGFTLGEYVATGRGPSGAAVQSFGKYITVWKRQPDGRWKFMLDGGSDEKR